MSNKIKNILFHTLSLGLIVLGIYLSIKLSHVVLIKGEKDKLINWVPISIIFFAVWNGLTVGFISNVFFNWKRTIFNYIWFFPEYLNIKWVYHSDLGYFPIGILPNKLKIYNQKIISIEKITSVDTDGLSIEDISKFIKIRLDSVYQDRLRNKQKAQKDKEKKDEIMKWDGYLDTASRRDNKIKEILK